MNPKMKTLPQRSRCYFLPAASKMASIVSGSTARRSGCPDACPKRTFDAVSTKEGSTAPEPNEST